MKNKLAIPVLFVLALLAIALGVSALVTEDDQVEMKTMQSSMMQMMSSMEKMMEQCEKMMGGDMGKMMDGMMSPEGMSPEEHASHHQ